MNIRLKTHHPAGLATLFFTELWERFSYYGMRALLVLFLVAASEQGGFGWTNQEAARLYGWYTGLVYLTPVIGGYVADRYLGAYRSVLLGGSIIALGHFALAAATPWFFFLGLSFLVVGTGLFKANISTLVGRLFDGKEAGRDAGFTIFYMGINLGALLGPIVCGYFAQRPDFGWHYGFGAAGVGMVLGLFIFTLYGSRTMGLNSSSELPIVTSAQVAQPLTSDERKRLLALFVLVFFVIFFWLAFEQAGTSLTLFAEHQTDRTLPAALGLAIGVHAIPTAWFQSINPAFILLLAPVFSSLWRRFAAVSGDGLDSIAKMVLGLVLLAAGFVVMVLGALKSTPDQLLSPWYLVATYFLHTCGELCLSPVGLSLVSRLAPRQIAAMVMGVWFLANFCANVVGGYLAGALDAVSRGEYFTVFGGQADFFGIFVVTSGAAALLLAAIRPQLLKLAESGSTR